MAKHSEAMYLGRLPDVRLSFQLMGLHARRADSNWTYPSHEHSMYEIHWMMEGQMSMVINGKLHQQSKGDLLFIRPGITHACTGAGPEGFTYFSVHFSVHDTSFAGNSTAAKTPTIQQHRIWLWRCPRSSLHCMSCPQSICLNPYPPRNK